MTGAHDPGANAIDFAYDSMKIDDRWSVREPRGFTWWGHRLAQRVWADPPRDDDGIPVGKLHARTTVLRDLAVESEDDFLKKLALLNSHATHSPLVWDRDARTLAFHTYVYLHPHNVDWAPRYFMSALGLQAADAHLKTDTLATALGGRPAYSAHPQSGERSDPDEMLTIIDALYAPAGAAGSPFDEQDFDDVIAMAESFGNVGFSKKGGFSFETPVRGEGRPAMLQLASGPGLPETALVVGNNTENPQLGHGLLLLLKLPVFVDGNAAASRLANDLNEQELRDWSRANMVGAWCTRDDNVVFVSFLPAAFHVRGLLGNMCMSLGIKAVWAVRYVDGKTS